MSMIGQQVGSFRILEEIGRGGMGTVYKGVDVHLDRPVAIKMLNAELANNPEIVDRFRAEAKAQANLNHVNLATLYAFLVENGSAYMVMEFVDGETFEKIIERRGPLPPEDALPWFKQALLGIGAAHRMGIVHRDIKPSNLMVNRNGIVKVMDFGIAKVVGTRGATRTGMQLGTPAYMAPEQIQNGPINVRTDIYALGITLYQMLTGSVPFDTGSDFDIMNAQVGAPPPPLSQKYPYAPAQYQGVVNKALEKNPDARFQTVEEFGAALERPEAFSGSAPAVVTAPKATVIETPAGAGSSVAPTRSAVAATVVAPAAPSTPVPAGTTAKPSGSKSRYLIAAGIAGAAVILLAIALLAHKRDIEKVAEVNGPSGASVNSALVQPKAEITGGDPSSLLNPPQQGNGNPGDGSNGGGSPITQDRGPKPVDPPPPNVVPRARPDRPPTTPKTTPQTQPQQQTTPPPQDAPKTDAPPSGMSQAEVDELEHHIDQLTSRATAVNTSLDTLRRQIQQSGGGSLRLDMATAQASMNTNLTKAQNAMERNDPVKAKKYADQAATDLETLEHFLGR
jgi:serine/threonine-protein kinase